MPKKTNENERPQLSQPKQTIEDVLAGTEAGRIWDDIKDREIFMFALPNQVVSQHAKPVLIDPSILHLILVSSAALPSLEEAVGRSDPRRKIVSYQVELTDRFVVVKPAPLTLSEKVKKQ
jgi:hypothetical protein